MLAYFTTSRLKSEAKISNFYKSMHKHTFWDKCIAKKGKENMSVSKNIRKVCVRSVMDHS